MLRYVVPIFEKEIFMPMLKISLLGAVFAGVYGVLHNQITFTISNEYFLKIKYLQFDYLNFGGSDRVRISIIGFFAACWAGLLSGWFLSRWFLPHGSLAKASRKIFLSSIIVFATSLVSATVGGAYIFFRRESIDYSNWNQLINYYNIEGKSAFINVAYIHNGSYLGVLFGMLIAIALVKR